MQNWTARPRRKHEASMRQHEDMEVEMDVEPNPMAALMVVWIMFLVFLCISGLGALLKGFGG